MDVCVFCSSAKNLAACYEDAARDLGRAIGARGHALVFGGFETGLMGTVARAAKDAGARVVGVLPCKLGDMPGRPVFACDEIVETSGLAERKVRMGAASDAFAALPGSFGTLDELYDVLALEKLAGGERPRPVAALNVGGFFDPLDDIARRMIAEGFMTERAAALYRSFDNVKSLMDHLEGRAGDTRDAR